VTCRDVDVLDHVQSSRIEKLLSALHTPGRQRESSSRMLRLEIEAVRATPVAAGGAEELLKIKLQLAPIRLKVDGGTQLHV
jgi:hypothetical protein